MCIYLIKSITFNLPTKQIKFDNFFLSHFLEKSSDKFEEKRALLTSDDEESISWLSLLNDPLAGPGPHLVHALHQLDDLLLR